MQVLELAPLLGRQGVKVGGVQPPHRLPTALDARVLEVRPVGQLLSDALLPSAAEPGAGSVPAIRQREAELGWFDIAGEAVQAAGACGGEGEWLSHGG